jgi:hypothetical protein
MWSIRITFYRVNLERRRGAASRRVTGCQITKKVIYLDLRIPKKYEEMTKEK